MTAKTTAPAEMVAGAASCGSVDWQAIDWRQVNQTVRRLQARIVKATQQGRWGKVTALQHLLTHSFSGKALAVRRVTENQGKRTSPTRPSRPWFDVGAASRHGDVWKGLSRISGN